MAQVLKVFHLSIIKFKFFVVIISSKQIWQHMPLTNKMFYIKVKNQYFYVKYVFVLDLLLIFGKFGQTHGLLKHLNSIRD